MRFGVVAVGVNIRFFGDGGWRFRPYGESLGRAPSNQGLLPLSFGASPRLGIPSLRSCSVGPPPSAIHGRGRLTRHPCRVAHCAEPALGLSRGRSDQKPDQKPRRANARPDEWWKSKAYAISCRSRLAGEKRLGDAFIQTARVIVGVHRCDAVTRQASSYNFESCEPNPL